MAQIIGAKISILAELVRKGADLCSGLLIWRTLRLHAEVLVRLLEEAVLVFVTFVGAVRQYFMLAALQTGIHGAWVIIITQVRMERAGVGFLNAIATGTWLSVHAVGVYHATLSLRLKQTLSTFGMT
jgi:hypothetical protein